MAFSREEMETKSFIFMKTTMEAEQFEHDKHKLFALKGCQLAWYFTNGNSFVACVIKKAFRRP